MLTAVGQYVGGKVLTAILVVAGAGAVIWFWKHPEHLKTIWLTIKYVLVWLGFVLVLPWAMFFVTPMVVGKESNALVGLMLVGYAFADAVVALFLVGGVKGHDVLTWMVLLLGFLAAGVYNYVVCEFQAARLEEV